MGSDHSKRSRLDKLIAVAAVAATTASVATPANASPGEGAAAIKLADHDKGRTLSGQGVRVLANAPASKQAQTLTLPIVDVSPVAPASAKSNGALSFKRGKKSVALANVHFDLANGTLAGTLGKEEIAVFKLGAAPGVNGATGAVSLAGGKLRLTSEAAKALKEDLGLSRALRHNGVGMIWLNAQAKPTHAAAQKVVSGSVNWGVLASWRKYVSTDSPAPGPPDTGTITVSEGATANGELSVPNSYFGFPVTGGTFQKGLYGASDKLALQTQGAVKFAKPVHCIDEVLFSGINLTIDGSAAGISLNAKNELGKPSGMTCLTNPAVSTPDVAFATLGSVTPTQSGNTVTWVEVPSALTAAGSTAWGVGPPYIPGKALDAVTITVNVG